MNHPRNLPPSEAARVRNMLTAEPGLAAGQSKALRRGRSNGVSGGRAVPPTLQGSRDRITIEWYSDDVLADEGNISSWAFASTYDSEGDSIQFASGRFHLFGEGIYCVTIRVIASSIDVGTSDMVVAAAAGIWDRPDPESIAAITRGQTPTTDDTGSMTASTTFYSEGQGLASDGIQVFVRTNNLATSADAGRVFVMVAIQKIIAFD